MTLRNFPPADQCDPEDLYAIADLVVRDPRASWDLAGSREHIEALCRRYQALVQERDAARWADEVRGKACEAAIAQRDAARAEVRALATTLDAERNERQAEVLELEAARERNAELSQRLERTALLLDEQRETREANDRIQSAFSATCEAVTGKTIEQVNILLDEELAANPDVGPLHHARDQRDHQEEI